MNKLNTNTAHSSTSSEFDIQDMLILIWKHKLFVSLVTIIGIIISITYSLSIKNTYISYAKLLPVSEQNMSNQASQFSGLAAFAGIQMDPTTKANDAIERLQSFAFFNNEIYEGNEVFSASLLAAKSWDANSKQIEFDFDSFDDKKNIWRTSKPTERKVYKAFISKLDIKTEPGSSLVTLSFEHISPIFAKKTLDKIIYKLNESERVYDEIQANKSIKYLNAQLSTNNINEIKDVLSELLKSEIQKIVLVKAKDEYIFKTIDLPFIPEEKSGPHRSFICIAGAFLSFVLSVLLLLAFNFYEAFRNIRST
jgi:uncharacterized protein involved in exopolysaccharide biosynthesis